MLSPNHFSSMNHATATNNSSDLVCGKTIDSEQQAYSAQYRNKTYYFDSEACLNKFQQSPDSYLDNKAINKKDNNLVYWGLGAATMGVMMFFMLY